MIFVATPLAGAFVVDVEQRADDRGYFARTWCQREFADMGLSHEVVQCNLSHTMRRGTLRGMHWQAAPYGEAKLVRCARGAIWDVIIDLRPDSPTYTRHFGVELTSVSARALFVPEGFAHGFVTLEDETDVLYQMSQFHEPSAARGVRWNDPAFGIAWPISNPLLHPRDAHYPDFVRESKP
ncbi:MAG TPA: dTDP-4-dehydrorhamnose 3,5-epimerase [Gemmatimonadaceae bacterium]|nr:dTDP-4-dehydrorhamnose 3,5-epimerase [Gemmatimonadaceae bacterium]